MPTLARRLSMVMLAASLLLPAVASAQLAVGADAPDFTLVDTNGVSHTLSVGNVGHVVVLYFVGYG